MRRLWFLLLLPLAVGFPAHSARPEDRAATAPGVFSWWCTITTPVEGDPEYFLVNGRDAWERKATMTCSSPTMEFTQTVRVRFQSFNEGYGAGHKAQLSFNLTLWAKRAPFRFYSLVSGLVDNSLVHWQFRNEAYDLMGTVWTAGQYNARNSLTLGSLRIEPVEMF